VSWIEKVSCSIKILFLCVICSWAWNQSGFRRIILFSTFNFCSGWINYCWNNVSSCCIQCTKWCVMTWSWIKLIRFFRNRKSRMHGNTIFLNHAASYIIISNWRVIIFNKNSIIFNFLHLITKLHLDQVQTFPYLNSF